MSDWNNPKHRVEEPRGAWMLQDAKARFSEVVRRAHAEGPQHVTVHGRDEVVVVAADEFRRLKGARTGQDLIDALRSCPDPDVDLERDDSRVTRTRRPTSSSPRPRRAMA